MAELDSYMIIIINIINHVIGVGTCPTSTITATSLGVETFPASLVVGGGGIAFEGCTTLSSIGSFPRKAVADKRRNNPLLAFIGDISVIEIRRGGDMMTADGALSVPLTFIELVFAPGIAMGFCGSRGSLSLASGIRRTGSAVSDICGV